MKNQPMARSKINKDHLANFILDNSIGFFTIGSPFLSKYNFTKGGFRFIFVI